MIPETNVVPEQAEALTPYHFGSAYRARGDTNMASIQKIRLIRRRKCLFYTKAVLLKV